jgi:diphthamide biosynthesis protein 2
MESVGEDEDGTTRQNPQQRQYVNSMLCFLSLSNPPQGGYWIYSPAKNILNADAVPPPALHRQLKRRFFLTQKARDANVFGILVSNLSQQHLVEVVKSLQRLIDRANKSSYSFAVGKINPAKLSNFAEIEVFCLVACREHSLLDQEREYPVPVITPMELEIALGNLSWGEQAYSLDCQDVMIRQQEVQLRGGESSAGGEHEDDDDNDDAPYFSLVTGGYVSKTSATIGCNADLDLQNLPGQGQVMEYKSEAANFLKQREFQGLQSMVGETEAKPASEGLTGIASDYSGS